MIKVKRQRWKQKKNARRNDVIGADEIIYNQKSTITCFDHFCFLLSFFFHSNYLIEKLIFKWRLQQKKASRKVNTFK